MQTYFWKFSTPSLYNCHQFPAGLNLNLKVTREILSIFTLKQKNENLSNKFEHIPMLLNKYLILYLSQPWVVWSLTHKCRQNIRKINKSECTVHFWTKMHNYWLGAPTSFIPALDCSFCLQRETRVPATSTDSLWSAGPGQWGLRGGWSARRPPASSWTLVLPVVLEEVLVLVSCLSLSQHGRLLLVYCGGRANTGSCMTETESWGATGCNACCTSTQPETSHRTLYHYLATMASHARTPHTTCWAVTTNQARTPTR